jgi:hypothetical protein
MGAMPSWWTQTSRYRTDYGRLSMPPQGGRRKAEAPADLPEGYLYDFANSDDVLNRLTVANGRLATTTGMSYRLLVLDQNTQRMPLAVLRQIRDHVNAGATIVGPKPTESPSLMDDQADSPLLRSGMLGPVKLVSVGR